MQEKEKKAEENIAKQAALKAAQAAAASEGAPPRAEAPKEEAPKKEKEKVRGKQAADGPPPQPVFTPEVAETIPAAAAVAMKSDSYQVGCGPRKCKCLLELGCALRWA